MSDATTWTREDLDRIEAAQELEMAPRRRDGTPRKPVPIWVVRAGDEIYVRAAYGPGTGWHRVARANHAGRIRAGGVVKDVTIEDADDAAERSLEQVRAPPAVSGRVAQVHDERVEIVRETLRRGGVARPLELVVENSCIRSTAEQSLVSREGIPRGGLCRGRGAVADHGAHLVDR
jgi:hypothetical protein